MRKTLLQTLNRALGRINATEYAPVTIDSLQRRLSEELDWLDACPGRESLIVILQELAAQMRRARIVVSPGYSYLPDSFLLYLTGVTHVNPVEWDLPFSRFTKSIHNGAEIPFEAGSGCLDVARKVFSNRENEFIIEIEPGLFKITFFDGELLKDVKLRITTYSELDSFEKTLKDGWHPLVESSLNLFSRGATDDIIFFESDKMREMLFDFNPESMSDLVLLNAIFWPGRIKLFEKILDAKKNPNNVATYEDATIYRVLQDSYGVPVYQEQSLLLNDIPGAPNFPDFQDLAPKGHFIGRTMMAVETMWHWRNKTKVK